jgi:hypothetical protein
VPAEYPSATAAQPPSYTARVVATGLATAAGALLTSVLDSRGTLVGAVVVAMSVSALSQVMRVPLERRVKSVRAIVVIVLIGLVVGIGAMHARDIAQGRVVSMRFVRSLLADLVDDPSRAAVSDPAPTDEDSVPTEQAANQASSAPGSKPATSSMPTDKTSSPASDAARPQTDAWKPTVQSP